MFSHDMQHSVMSETVSLGKQSILVFLLHMLFKSFKAQSPKIRVSGPVVSFPCGLLFTDLLSVLTLLCDGKRISRASDGDPGSCRSTENLFCSLTLCCWEGLMFTLPFAAVHSCVLLGTGVEEEVLCLDRAASRITYLRALGLYLLVVPFSQEMI